MKHFEISQIAFGVISSFGWCESLLFSFRWSYLYLLPLLDICTAIHLLVSAKNNLLLYCICIICNYHFAAHVTEIS